MTRDGRCNRPKIISNSMNDQRKTKKRTMFSNYAAITRQRLFHLMDLGSATLDCMEGDVFIVNSLQTKM